MHKINTEQLEQLMDSAEDFRLINVLDEEQFNHAHIPGSENIPVEKADFIDEVRATTIDRDQRVVVYCASKQCEASHDAAKKLEAAGFTNVCEYEGGMKDWQAADHEVETG
jgi:rhodanese-related sulfurtransferase